MRLFFAQKDNKMCIKKNIYQSVVQSELDRLSNQENEIIYQTAYLIYHHKARINKINQQHLEIQQKKKLLAEQLYDES